MRKHLTLLGGPLGGSEGEVLERHSAFVDSWVFLKMGVGQKSVPQMDSWQMETWTKTCGALVV